MGGAVRLTPVTNWIIFSSLLQVQVQTQWNFQGFRGAAGAGGGYFSGPSRQRSSRFAAYGGYSTNPFIKRNFGLNSGSDKFRENWPQNSFQNSPQQQQQLPFNFNPKQQSLIIATTETPPAVTTTTFRTIPTTTPPTTTLRTSPSSTTEFVPVVRFEKTQASFVQTKRFPVLPAVPGLRETEPSTETYLVNDTIEDDENDDNRESDVLPGGFSPVPAVPGLSVASLDLSPPTPPPSAAPLVVSSPSTSPLVADTESIISNTDFDSRLETSSTEPIVMLPICRRPGPIVCRKVDVDDVTNNNNNDDDDVLEVQVDDAVIQRKQFKRCHGKCVQKFCLPINELTVFDNCSSKCKGICSE